MHPYHARAMTNLMRERRPPKELAERGQTIEIKEEVADFKRLLEIVDADLGAFWEAKVSQRWRQAPVDIKLRFGFDDARPGIPALDGHISTRVPAVCQRCLELFELELASELKLLLPPTGS